MKHKRVLVNFLRLLAGFSAASAGAESPAQTDIPLETPEGYVATMTTAVGNGRYCVSGFLYDDSVPTESAYVLLVDADSRKVVWRTPIPYGDDYVGNSAGPCMSDGTAFFVVTQDHTDSAEALNQTRVFINKISEQGKLVQRQRVEAGFDEWSYMLHVQAGAISVAGGTSATLARGGKFSTFVAQFDTNLVRTKMTKLDSGAFWTGSSARLDGQQMLVAGQFMPNTGSSDGEDSYAASKINLANNKYTWSTYASPADTRDATSVFGQDGSTYTVALTPTNLAVSVEDRTGKTINSFSVKKPLCGIDALTLDGNVLKAIGASCKKEAAPVIATIDLAGKTAAIARALDREISAPEFDGPSWVAVVDTKSNGKVFRRSGQ